MQYPIMPRLDPRSKFLYVCEDERGSKEFTTFHIRPLSVIEYRESDEVGAGGVLRMGTFGLKVLEYGLVGWDNFTLDDGKIIPFDLVNISAIPYKYQLELSQEIASISDMDEDLAYEMRVVAKWSKWLSDNEKNSSQWECEYCTEKKLYEKRNCDGTLPNKCPKCQKEIKGDHCDNCDLETKPQFLFRFSKSLDDFVSRCPIAIITDRAIKLTNLVQYIDNSKELPFAGGALTQTHFFYLARMIVMSEQNAILKKELDEMKNKKPEAAKTSHSPMPRVPRMKPRGR